MSIRIGDNKGLFSNMQKSQQAGPMNRAGFGSNTQKSGNSLRKMEYEQRMQGGQKSVTDQTLSYAQQLRASREKAKDVALEKKRVQYSFKKVSSQIIRSKTSVNARKAAMSARREVARLKRLKTTDQYDENELQLAIDHAKSMEKVAKKKVVHLEQEEMVERAQKRKEGGASGFTEKIEESAGAENEQEKELQEIEDAATDPAEEYTDAEQIYENIASEYEGMELQDFVDAARGNSMESMSELVDEISSELSELMEEMDFTELSESLFAPNPNMSEEDFKMFKLKHRTKEMKEIAEADKAYLKGLIEYEKSKSSSGAQMPTSSAAPMSSAFAASSEPRRITPMISMPGASMGGSMAPAPTSGGFDVSV